MRIEPLWARWITAELERTQCSSVTWSNWVSSSSTTADYRLPVNNSWQSPMQRVQAAILQPEETVEQLAERERRRQISIRAREIQAEEDVIAQGRAKALLHEILTPDQRRILKDRKGFPLTVQTAEGEKKFWVEYGIAGNIYELDTQGNRIARYCCHPDMYLPTEDHMVTQVLWLRANPEGFFKKANKTRLRSFGVRAA